MKMVKVEGTLEKKNTKNSDKQNFQIQITLDNVHNQMFIQFLVKIFKTKNEQTIKKYEAITKLIWR